MATGAELTYNTGASALAMASEICGDGVTVAGAGYLGAANSQAIHTNGQLSPGVVPSPTGVILSAGNAASFTQSNGDPNRLTGTSTGTSGPNTNAAFNAIAGASTYDAAWLDVSFIPTGTAMTIRFVLSSEEYPEYIKSSFNDADLPIFFGTGVAGVNNINGANQQNLDVSNAGDQYNARMDGFTPTLSLNIPVNGGVVNSIRLGIADTGDATPGSNVLIAGSPVKAAVVAGRTITLPTGQMVLPNANGTFTITGDGAAENVNFSFTVAGGGNSDVGVVKIDSVPRFVAGTLIRTPFGEVPVENIGVGDLIMTHDEGAQRVRRSGRRQVPAVGALAPIMIKAGTFGPHGTPKVSARHRVLMRDELAELPFGTAEGLATESVLPGAQTSNLPEQDAIAEIRAIFPEMDPATGSGYSRSAGRRLRRYEAQLPFGPAQPLLCKPLRAAA